MLPKLQALPWVNGADELSVRNIASNEKKHLFGRLFH